MKLVHRARDVPITHNKPMYKYYNHTEKLPQKCLKMCSNKINLISFSKVQIEYEYTVFRRSHT